MNIKSRTTFAAGFIKKERKLSDINDKKSFCKIMKPLRSNNSSQSSKITLVDKVKIISEDLELSKTFDTRFKNTVGNPNIKKNMNSLELKSTSTHDPLDIYILK